MSKGIKIFSIGRVIFYLVVVVLALFNKFSARECQNLMVAFALLLAMARWDEYKRDKEKCK